MQFDGNKLKERRKIKRLTQAGLADAIGVSRNYVNQLENGRKRPSLQLLEQIASALGCSAKYFFN